jgi:dUTP pyrophosphatase
MAALQKLGYTNKCGDQEVITNAVGGSDRDDHDFLTNYTLQVQLLSVNGTIPKRATVDSVGYDLYSATDMTLQPNQRVKILTDVSIIPPRGTYGQIMPRSGLAVHHCIDTKAGVIDPDYRGNIIVILHNYVSTAYEIKVDDRIAQVVFYCIKTPSTDIASSLFPTLRGDGGLGSTGKMHSLQIANENQAVLNQDVPNPLPFEIWMSHDPFDAVIPVQIDLKGHHPTLGMVFETCPIHNRLCLKDIVPSTTAAKIKKWWSTIKHHHLVSVGTQLIRTIEELTSAIKTFMDNNNLSIQLCFSVDKYFGINPTSQVPILHWDQLNAISDINKSINQHSGHHHQ